MSDARNFLAYRRAVADMGRLRVLRYTMFPPGALRQPLFEVAVTQCRDSFLVETTCVHRYPGPYQLGVICARPIGNPVSPTGLVEIVATFEDAAGRLVLKIERSISFAEHVWWGGPSRNGFGLAWYAVPAEVPIQTQVRCKVQVLDTSGALAHYRPMKLYSRYFLVK